MVKSVKDIESSPLSAGIGASMQMLISPMEGPHFAMRKFVIKKGGSMPLHTNSVEHEQYVLGGSAKVTLDKETFIANKDDVL
ncbi:MAG: cupin domain-containing protein, partial [Sulfurospirillaceae bacterium]|nr:cupin domain-containing protein [Sulfurospirillaceae bacterium]